MGERGGEVWPEEHLSSGDELVPEPEGQFRDDLRGIERLPVGLHAADRGRNILVGVGVTAVPASIAPQLAGKLCR